MNLRPSGYEPDELPGCSTPRPLRRVMSGADMSIVQRGYYRFFSGLAVTYSPTSFDAVPLARRHLTAEFGMGSGVLLVLKPPDQKRSDIGVPYREYCPRMLLEEGLPSSGSNQANRAISTGQLNALLRLHLRPIDVVVFHGSQGIPCFEGGFTLRCLQRLSCPFIATQHCRWHDNWSTSGTFTPVLSY